MSLRDIFVHFGVSVDQTALLETQTSVNRLVLQFRQLQRIAGFAVAAIGIGAITDSSDAYNSLANRLKSVTKSTAEFESAQRGVQKIADDTLRPVEDIAEAFQRYTTATEGLGLSQDETLDFTKRLTQGIVLGGASAAETHGVLVQLGQGMTNNFKSGGQELNSLIEQAPKLATGIAKAIGGPAAVAGNLKEMAKQGKLTGRAIVDAVRSMGAEYDKSFGQRTLKFEDLRTLAWNQWLEVMKQIEPFMGKIKGHLKDMVLFFKAWVKDGSAVNSLIAALVVGVGVLTVAFGGLAAQVALALAPWAAAFVVVEDFVTFLRGGRSTIGRFFETVFGEGAATNVRNQILSIWEAIKSGNWDPFYEGAAKAIFKIAALLQRVLQDAVAAVGVAVANDPTLSALATIAQHIVGKPGENRLDEGPVGPQMVVPGSSNDIEQTRKDHPIQHWIGDLLFSDEFLNGIQQRARDRALQAQGIPTAGESADAQVPTFPTGLGPTPSLPGRYKGADVGIAPIAPIVTNNITVEGSATPATAREIAKQAGQATVSALGRDRSAISVGFAEGGI